MKKIFLLLAFSSTFLFTSCHWEDDDGNEPYFPILGQVFETNINLEYDPLNNIYSRIVNIPTSIEVFESDAILVYRLEGTTSNGDDIWGALPQNFFFGNGNIIQYVFNHTFFDVEILIDGNFDLATLETEFTDNQIFRIAIVPAEFAKSDLTMEDLMQGLQINTTEIETLD